MRTNSRIAMLLVMVLLTGCGVENIAGVDLSTAAISPTSTPVPTSSPEPLLSPELTNTATTEFVGTTVSLDYPDGWEAVEGGQSLTVFDPAFQNGNGPGVGLFFQLTRQTGLATDDSSESIAPQAMALSLQRFAGGGYVHADSVPETDEALGFRWGSHDAAIFPWHSQDGAITGVNVVVMDSDRRRFVLIGAQVDSTLWEDFEPTWLAIVGSFTLDGEALPAADIRAAYRQAVGG
jgi:hypothetical protein